MAVGERGQDRVEVELEDAPAERGSVGARRRRRWPVWVGVAVVLALGATSAVLTTEDRRRDEERREALAEVSGLVAPLDGPLEEAWSVDDAWLAAVVHDVVVLSAPPGESLTAVDLRTGEQVWTRPVADDETCTTLGPQSSRPGSRT